MAEPSNPRRPVRRSLRRAVVAAFLPLCVVGGIGLAVVVSDTRQVHVDLQRMFEELREVSLSRSLLDELRGIEQWVDAAPAADGTSEPLVYDDLRHHLDAALATFAKFSIANDPSEQQHVDAESRVLERIGGALQSMRAALAGDRAAIGELREPLALAVHGAEVITSAVQQESREIGDGLDGRTQRLFELLLVLGIAAVGTVGWLALLLLRRVLVPVQEIRRVVQAVGEGRSTEALTVRYRDELGDLAEAFTAMAGQVRRSKEELERRVEERSREVLRTARLAELGTLAAGIAHEVNNPIASIVTCAEGLLREHRGGDGDGGAGGSNADREPRRRLLEYLEIIRKEAMRTRDITARLLRFARHGSGRRDTVWLGDELREIAPMFAHQFADAGVELELVVDGRGPAIVGDGAEWRQVVFNLLRNALDASPRGAVVRVGCRQQADTAWFEVEDRGGGVREQDLERIFEPFFTTKAPGKGTGLGLAIAHRIVTDHGGSIAVTNTGTGALFRVAMPAAAMPPGIG
ncbi:MAG: HAMP domain-containing protein [Planctomycetes bacterium]|nr:HAMP domain-containing protein [Planctomycetota bacterium]